MSNLTKADARAIADAFSVARYSARNQEAILDACPEATLVHGYETWMAWGRHPLAGHGIRIGQPIVREDEKTGKPKVVNVRPCIVFDVSGTEPLTDEVRDAWQARKARRAAAKADPAPKVAKRATKAPKVAKATKATKAPKRTTASPAAAKAAIDKARALLA